MEHLADSKPLDPEMKVNLAALRKCDEFVLDILETSSHVAVYKFDPIKKEWEKTEVEGSLFLCRRSTLPKFALIIMNRLNRENLIVHITKEMEFKVQKPFLLYKNFSLDIQGIWFTNNDKCEKVGEHITGLYTSPVVQPGSIKESTERKIDKKNILTMFAEAQRKYNETKVQTTPNGPSSQIQDKGNISTKTRSKSMTMQSSLPVPYLLPAPVENEDSNQPQTLDEDPCIVRSSPLKPSTGPSQGNLSKSLPNSAKKTPQRQLFAQELFAFPSSLPTEKLPFPSIPMIQSTPSAMKSGSNKSGLPSQRSGSDITLAASLMSPMAFQSSRTVVNSRPETPILTKEQLQETLLYLLQKDSDFLEKIHTTYLRNVCS